MNTIAFLNQLLALHSRSLPMYLVSAPPHRDPLDGKAREVLQNIVNDQQLMVDRVAEVIEAEGGIVELGEFPMEYTDLHDLSMDYIMPYVMARQSDDLRLIEGLSKKFADGSAPKAVAQEAVGAATAHLQSLEECCQLTA